MSQAFRAALYFTLRWEGGLSDHESDRGGLTKYGISQRAYPDVDILNLTEEQAAEIYERDYWLPIQGDSLPEFVAFVLFDHAVNSGPRAAVKALQRLVGTRADGQIGPVTLRAVELHPEQDLAQDLIEARASFLIKLAHRRPDQRVFLRGWMNRLLDLAFTLGTL